MRSAFLPLVILWPAAFGALTAVLAVDANALPADPRRPAELLVMALMTGGVALAFGFRDASKLAEPEGKPDRPRSFVRRTHALYALVFAMVAAARAAIWLVDPAEYRLFPAVVALIAFVGVRPLLDPEAADTNAPDREEHYGTKIPESLKKGDK